MKNAYLFAIEIDQWGKKLSAEINSLIKTNASHPLIGILGRLKDNVGLLAICITSSLGNSDEDKLMDHLIADCKALALSDLSATSTVANPQLCYQDINSQLTELIHNYQVEKQKPITDEQRVNDTIANFNLKTANFMKFYPSQNVRQKPTSDQPSAPISIAL